MTGKRHRLVQVTLPHDPEQSDEELAALWANPAFRAAIEEGRAGLGEGAISLDDLDRELGLSEEQKAAADAWLDANEQRLAIEGWVDPGAAALPSAHVESSQPPKLARPKKRKR